MDKMHKGYLDYWIKCSTEDGKYTWYEGQFRDHPLFHGHWGHTSNVLVEVGNEIETLNSRYTLGLPNLLEEEKDL